MQLRYILTSLLFIFSLLSFGAYAIDSLPQISVKDRRWVGNPDGIISEEDEKKINELITKYEKQSSRPIFVMAIKQIDSKEDYSSVYIEQLLDHSKVVDKELDNGLLILFVENGRHVIFKASEKLEYRFKTEIGLRIEYRWMWKFLSQKEYSKALVKGVEGVIHFLDTGSVELPAETSEIPAVNEKPDRRDKNNLGGKKEEKAKEDQEEDDLKFGNSDTSVVIFVLGLIIWGVYYYRKKDRRRRIYEELDRDYYRERKTSPNIQIKEEFSVPTPPTRKVEVSVSPRIPEPLTIPVEDSVKDELPESIKNILPNPVIKVERIKPKPIIEPEPVTDPEPIVDPELIVEAEPIIEPKSIQLEASFFGKNRKSIEGLKEIKGLKEEIKEEPEAEPQPTERPLSDYERRREEDRERRRLEDIERERKRERDREEDRLRENRRMQERGIEREREQERMRERERERELEREREQEKMRERERERERQRDRGFDRTTW